MTSYYFYLAMGGPGLGKKVLDVFIILQASDFILARLRINSCFPLEVQLLLEHHFLAFCSCSGVVIFVFNRAVRHCS
jgi:hypothetical protein